MLKAAKAYLSTQVTTATQGDLLLMLYDTAIKHIKLAKDKIAERDFAAKGILITKAIEIVSELHESLNKEKGGEVAKNLSRMYFLCNTRLLQGNMEMNPKRLDEVVAILSGLRRPLPRSSRAKRAGPRPRSPQCCVRKRSPSLPQSLPQPILRPILRPIRRPIRCPSPRSLRQPPPPRRPRPPKRLRRVLPKPPRPWQPSRSPTALR